MTVILYAADGRKFYFNNPIRLEISGDMYKSGSIFFMAAAFAELPVITRIKAVSDGQAIFYGTVDKQIESLSDKGRTVKINGRDISGILLDNEAAPAVYESAWLEDILSRHVYPYGICCDYGDNPRCEGAFTVTKGMSEFGAVEKFCRMAKIGRPFCNAEGRFDIRRSRKNHYFGVDSVISAEKSVMLYKPISEIILSNNYDRQYNIPVKSDGSEVNAVGRKRYRRYSMLSESEQYAEARRCLSESRYGSIVYKAVTAGFNSAQVADGAEINFDTVKCGGLIINRKRFVLSPEGVYTEIYMVPKNDIF